MSETEELNNKEIETVPQTELRDKERSALLVAQTFIIFSAIYWFLQIESVRDLLELAYG